ncbi:GIY-YIG nuclease family protein [Priestia megaterium]|uniref:GIY-YIG nuclease family protein n=1 Tax=Priestia megaterium TaxID=1404 RepID=UPI002E20AF38|nr:GIY-YIG nuclease family protein [Priestia megaterium]
MRNDAIALLKKKGYYPLKSSLWKYFKFTQVKPRNRQDFINNIELLKQQTGVRKGIYIYINNSNEVLYIGKGNPIKDRLISHYKKLSKTVLNNDKRTMFFQQNEGNVKIYWLEIENQEERELVEHLLAFVLNPLYRKWRPI